VHVHATATATQSDLGPPQTDSRPVARHHPDSVAAAAPALDHGKTQDAGVELLGGGKIALLEYQLADAVDWYWPITRHDAKPSRGAS
jgi:hypothetical protein